ncbi:hypothetical protein KIN20_018045 [Parelaphostrongylus tenuis]|uniref:Uncharacterized protein n=1 Tax=Parelaphostrongylus tenuis TaxID=148309 RepID=A0AAD5MMD7_PARTN|nr:hypothetical protein KIN20_018045 [Parelaphostrongylus tenuis]
MVFTRSGRSTRRESGSKEEFTVIRDHVSPISDPQETLGDDSDSDAPEEISSKPGPDIRLLTDPSEGLSLFEELQEKKRKLEKHRVDKVEWKRRKRVKKVDKGEYRVKEKKAEFKVLTLDEGIKKTLEPRINFRDELLKARTAGKRERVPNAAALRAKWI